MKIKTIHIQNRHLKFANVANPWYFIFVLSLLVGCASDEQEIIDTKANQYNEYVSETTKGANFINGYIQLELTNGRVAETKELILEATDQFLISEGYSSEERHDAHEYLKTVIGQEVDYYYDVKSAPELSDAQMTFITALELIFNQEASYEETISMIDALEKEAFKHLSEQESQIVLMSIATARSQSTFWYENPEVLDANGRVLCVKSWREVGRKAVGGGLGGAAGCAVASLFGPVGWKIWGACVLGGAAATAVEEIWDQCTAPNNSYSQCKRWSGGNPNNCYGYLNPYDLKPGWKPTVNPNLLIRIDING